MEKGKIQLNIEGIDEVDTLRYQEILVALIACGGLSGVKGGRTIIHFDQEGVFQGIELDYWPWRRRKKT
jgi:hypothetical protein